jgi:hypothetical protein
MPCSHTAYKNRALEIKSRTASISIYALRFLLRDYIFRRAAIIHGATGYSE